MGAVGLLRWELSGVDLLRSRLISLLVSYICTRVTGVENMDVCVQGPGGGHVTHGSCDRGRYGRRPLLEWQAKRNRKPTSNTIVPIASRARVPPQSSNELGWGNSMRFKNLPLNCAQNTHLIEANTESVELHQVYNPTFILCGPPFNRKHLGHD